MHPIRQGQDPLVAEARCHRPAANHSCGRRDRSIDTARPLTNSHLRSAAAICSRTSGHGSLAFSADTSSITLFPRT
jgi:hypothetical protein